MYFGCFVIKNCFVIFSFCIVKFFICSIFFFVCLRVIDGDCLIKIGLRCDLYLSIEFLFGISFVMIKVNILIKGSCIIVLVVLKILCVNVIVIFGLSFIDVWSDKINFVNGLSKIRKIVVLIRLNSIWVVVVCFVVIDVFKDVRIVVIVVLILLLNNIGSVLLILIRLFENKFCRILIVVLEFCMRIVNKVLIIIFRIGLEFILIVKLWKVLSEWSGFMLLFINFSL